MLRVDRGAAHLLDILTHGTAILNHEAVSLEDA
jgi:hypothetical protein